MQREDSAGQKGLFAHQRHRVAPDRLVDQAIVFDRLFAGPDVAVLHLDGNDTFYLFAIEAVML